MRCEDAMRKADRSHLASCPSCLARLDQLARAALSGRDGEISCAECRGRLPLLRGLAEAGPADAGDPGAARSADAAAHADRVDEAPARARFGPAWQAETLTHLVRCPDCADELEALSAVLALWEAGRLPAFEAMPAFDLSFLEPVVAPLWRPREASATAGDIVRRLLADLVVSLGEGGARFTSLPAGLAARPLALDALRDAAGPEGESIQLPDPAADMSIHLVVGPLAGARAVIAVTLRRHASGQPLAGARVVLYGPDGELLASAVTAEDGSLQFRDLGAGPYLIEIRRPEGRWQLPLRIAERAA
ncbi:MAG: carboxypeptidase regulatory-like domain-containing protein [Caldilineae bacterium]|nr:carboxypeptidase regulatory-like domain-containing protein [Caldilineae bacterium]